MSTRLLTVCLAILCLAVAFHLGARSTVAAPQQPANQAVAVSGNGVNVWMTLTSSGDAYWTSDNGAHWTFQGNIYGNPTPTR